MSNEWIDFLNAQAVFAAKPSKPNKMPTSNTITAPMQLAIIEVAGKDAQQFLQGQLTCNIDDISQSNSFFAAFCNAKGRIISTLLVLKNNENLLLIVPQALLETVLKKLSMYILRARVQLNAGGNNYCLIGINSSSQSSIIDYPSTDFGVSNGTAITLKLRSNQPRYLLISPIDKAQQLWLQLTQNDGLTVTHPEQWAYQDLSAGLAWLDATTTEQYTPQMLNLDKLGGISFQKGCYTGQEIIARSHYLGTTKRELFLAECAHTALVERPATLISNDDQRSSGTIVAVQTQQQRCRMLVVIPSAAAALNNFNLNNANQDRITLLDFQ